MNKINTVNYCGKKVTDNNNIYNGSNIGKYTGLGIGAAVTTKEIYDINKNFKQDKEFRKFYNKFVTNIINAIETTSNEIISIDIKKYKKIGKSVTYSVLSTVFIGLGLIIGAIIDKIINIFRAQNADEIAQMQQNYLIEEYLKAIDQEQYSETKNLS